MPGVQTYTLIQEQTLSSPAASVTFSSIPQIYEDLVLEVVVRESANVNASNLRIRFNGDTGTNYSRTFMEGNGSTASSGRDSNISYAFPIVIVGNNASSGVFSTASVNIMSYSSPSVFKTLVSTSSVATATVNANVSLWRSTSAVTSLVASTDQTGFASGSTFYLYGLVG